MQPGHLGRGCPVRRGADPTPAITGIYGQGYNPEAYPSMAADISIHHLHVGPTRLDQPKIWDNYLAAQEMAAVIAASRPGLAPP